jgi:outer membrane protein OmpA-like peptidoglycan-associated protein
VYFSPPGSYQIRAEDEAKILNWYSALPSPTRMKIKTGKLPLVVEGYASTTAAALKNKDLSEKRAHRARDILKKIAGSSAKFVMYSYGESKASTPDEVEDPKERRVKISVTDN